MIKKMKSTSEIHFSNFQSPQQSNDISKYTTLISGSEIPSSLTLLKELVIHKDSWRGEHQSQNSHRC